MNAAKSQNLPSVQQPWAHFDKSVGDIVISERDYIEGTYTFGASNKCRITLEFSELVVPGLTGRPGNTSMDLNGAQWLQVRWPGEGEFEAGFGIGSGFFDFDPGSGQPTTAWNYKQWLHIAGGLMQVASPTSSASWSTLGDIALEIFTLQVTFNRTALAPNITVDFRTANGIVLVDNANYTGSLGQDRMPAAFSFRTGSRMLEEYVAEIMMFNPFGAVGHRITKFYCEDIA